MSNIITVQQGRRSLALYIDSRHPVLQVPLTSAKKSLKTVATPWQHIATHRSNGGAAGPSTVLGEGLLVGVGALSGVSRAVLRLPVLGQVEGGDLLRLLDLLLVGLDLALQLVDQGLHALVVPEK